MHNNDEWKHRILLDQVVRVDICYSTRSKLYGGQSAFVEPSKEERGTPLKCYLEGGCTRVMVLARASDFLAVICLVAR